MPSWEVSRGVREGLKTKSTLAGAVVGALVGAFVGALVRPLVGQISLSPALHARLPDISERVSGKLPEEISGTSLARKP